jgi:hypothetical protein
MKKQDSAEQHIDEQWIEELLAIQFIMHGIGGVATSI